MEKRLNIIFAAYVLLAFSLWIPFVLLAHILVKFIGDEHKRLRVIYRVHRVWIGIWESMTRIKIDIQNHHYIDHDQAYMFVANHSNMLDVLAVGSCIQHPWKSLVKRELLSVPFVGWIIGNISISVDRSNRESRRTSLFNMIQSLKDGVSVLVFPEGTRNRTPEPLKRFHIGAFRAAIAAQVPVMPIVLLGIRDLQPVDTIEFYPGDIRMKFLGPIPTEGLGEGDVQQLLEKVQAVMRAEILAGDPHFTRLAGRMARA
jgi:1-acyl-sn-glycerol-3-phosphate acyltransferase